MKTQKERGLYCFDWDALSDDLVIQSIEDDNNYQRIELLVLPCNYIHKEFGNVGDSIAPECIADQKKQQEYLGNMRSMVYISEQVFHQNQYDEEAIMKSSKFFIQQVDNINPSWLNGQIMTNQLQDEVDYIQYGQEAESTFYSFEMSQALPSSWIYWPTAEHPSKKYKYVGIEINFHLDQKVVTRQTYSILDWLGDLGGLYDAIYYIFYILLKPISAFALNSTIMTSFFRLKGDSYKVKNISS